MRTAAKQHWGNSEPFNGHVFVSITNFFLNGGPPDLDNMAKPILDALGTVVYEDDRYVFDLLCRKRDLREDPRITSPSQILLARLADPGPFVYIQADDGLNQGVTI